MNFFKPVVMILLFSIFVCSALIFFGAPPQSVLLGGFTVIVLSMGRSIYDHYKNRAHQKMDPFL